MTLQETIIGSIVPLASLTVNVIAKKLGYPEVVEKQIRTYVNYIIFLAIVLTFCFLTFKYS